MTVAEFGAQRFVKLPGSGFEQVVERMGMKILLIVNESKSQAIDAALLLRMYFSSQGIEYDAVRAIDLVYDDDRDADPILNEDACHYDMAVALGGDGTMLSAANALAGRNIPILGINFGHMGFLTNRSDDNVVSIVAAALAGDATTEERMHLAIEVYCEAGEDEADQADEDGFIVHRYSALNEISITRGASGRIVTFNLSISGDNVADLRGDGVVIATPTGSTAYALSAGGPIVSPCHRAMVVVPIAPHSLTSRAIVTDSNDVVEITLGDDDASREVAVFVDGRDFAYPHPAHRIVVRRAPYSTTMVCYKRESFYKRLSQEFF